MSEVTRVLIIAGYGRLGKGIIEHALASADVQHIIALKRSEFDEAFEDSKLQKIQADITQLKTWKSLSENECIKNADEVAIVLCATPGLRRSRGLDPSTSNQLHEAAEPIKKYFSDASLLYSGSTAVYGDMEGEDCAEDGMLGDSPHAQGLLDIEAGLLAINDKVCVLRLSALVDPQKMNIMNWQSADEKVRYCTGPLERPFPCVLLSDAVKLCWRWFERSISGHVISGIFNVASTERMSAREYFERSVELSGRDIEIIEDTREGARRMPSRRVISNNLEQEFTWEAWQPIFP